MPLVELENFLSEGENIFSKKYKTSNEVFLLSKSTTRLNHRRIYANNYIVICKGLVMTIKQKTLKVRCSAQIAFENYGISIPEIMSPNKGSFARFIILGIEIQKLHLIQNTHQHIALSISLRKKGELITTALEIGQVNFSRPMPITNFRFEAVEKAIRWPWSNPELYLEVLESIQTLLMTKEIKEPSLKEEIKKLETFITER